MTAIFMEAGDITLSDKLTESLRRCQAWGRIEGPKCEADVYRYKAIWNNLRTTIIRKLTEKAFFSADWVPAHMEAFHAGFYGEPFDVPAAVEKIMAQIAYDRDEEKDAIEQNAKELAESGDPF